MESEEEEEEEEEDENEERPQGRTKKRSHLEKQPEEIYT